MGGKQEKIELLPADTERGSILDGQHLETLNAEAPPWLANGRSWQLKLLNALRYGDGIAEALKKARVSLWTVRNYENNDLVFATELKLAMRQRPSALVERMEKQLIALAESKDVSEIKLKAILKILAVFSPERYGDAMHVRHSGLPVGAPTTVVNNTNNSTSVSVTTEFNAASLTDDQLLRIIGKGDEGESGEGISTPSPSPNEPPGLHDLHESRLPSELAPQDSV